MARYPPEHQPLGTACKNDVQEFQGSVSASRLNGNARYARENHSSGAARKQGTEEFQGSASAA